MADARSAGRRRALWRRTWVNGSIFLAALLVTVVIAGGFVTDRTTAESVARASRWALGGIVAVGWIGIVGTLPVLVFGLRWVSGGRPGRLRQMVRVLAVSSGLLATVVIVLWFRASPLNTQLAGLSMAIRQVITVATFVVIANVLWWWYRLELRHTLRRHRHSGRHAWPPVALGVLAVAVMGIALSRVGIAPRLSGREPSLAMPDAPVRRVVWWAVDGIDQRTLTYWTALRDRSAISRLALGGTSAFFEWESSRSIQAWLDLTRGFVPRRQDGTPVRDRWSFDAVLERHLAFVPAVARRGGVVGDRPSLWELVTRTGRQVDVVGWSRPVLPVDAIEGRVVSADALMGIQELLNGSDAALATGRYGEPALLRALRDEARSPWSDWRRGFPATDADDALLAAVSALAIDPASMMSDYFRWNVAERFLEDGRAALHTTLLDFPRRIAAEESAATAESYEQVQSAMRAYLDVLDARIDRLTRSLSAGDAFILTFMPPPILDGPAAGQSGTGTALFTGEKVRPENARAEVIATSDLAKTLVYLAGCRTSNALEGRVAWSLLSEDLATHFPPSPIDSYPTSPAPRRR